MNALAAKTAEILLVEDEETDILFVQRAFQKSKLKSNLHVVTDGEQAMAFLRKEGDYTSVPKPDLVLLDLNMPRKNGKEVLAEIKKDSRLRRIPVAIMTSSDSEDDICNSYDLGANCYIRKPLDFDELRRAMTAIETFWFEVASLCSR
jgi:DNA-binding response OmpR family regulator